MSCVAYEKHSFRTPSSRYTSVKLFLQFYPKSPGPELIKLFFFMLSIKFSLLINMKMPTIAEHEIFSANRYENANNSWHFHIY